MASKLPSHDIMLAAMLVSDPRFVGVFFTAVVTTKIFCRPTCSAKKPRPENVRFFASAAECMTAGFRPCKRCRPLDLPDATPTWIAALLAEANADPRRQWSDDELRERGADPVTLRRWCKANVGLTFHELVRAHRVGEALGVLRAGASIDDAGAAAGYASVSGFRDAVTNVVGDSAGRSRTQDLLTYTRIETPLGPMLALASERGLVMLEFLDRPILVDELAALRERFACALLPGDSAHLQHATRELSAYFAGSLRDFTVPLDIRGTAFQTRVWHALVAIPYGATCSYGELARAIGQPTAQRAVGLANGQNQLAIIIPCHRVIGANGKLVGYGGGMARKQWLLRHEGALPQTELRLPI